MRLFLSLLKKELASISREKTILFAILVQFLIASLSSVILSGILAFYDPGALVENARFSPRAGYVGDIDNPLVTYLEDNRINVRFYPDLVSAESAFKSRQIDTILIVPENDAASADIEMILPHRETTKILMLVMLDKPLKRYENFLRENNGITVKYQDIEGKPYSSYEVLYAVIIPLLMLFPALVAGSTVIDTVSEEFENKTIETLLSTPVSINQVFFAKVTTAVLLSVVQMIAWVGLLKLNGMEIYSPVSLVVSAAAFSVAISIGAAAIAMYFNDRERSQFVYSITLVTIAVATYFLNISPVSLLTRLSAGAQSAGTSDAALYTLPLLVFSVIVYLVSYRIMLTRN